MSPGLILLVVPVAIMAGVFTWAIRGRRRYQVARTSPLAVATGRVPLGSAAAITDAGQVPWRDLLDGLAVQPEGAYHEGWMGTMLGLHTKWSTSTTLLEAHRMWGERRGRRVEIRLGPDDKVEGGTVLTSNKHIRAITTVAVPVPPFTLVGAGGAVTAKGEVPPAVAGVVGALSRSAPVWQDVTVTGGERGIVANRPAVADPLNRWLYDLWLCERLADALTSR